MEISTDILFFVVMLIWMPFESGIIVALLPLFSSIFLFSYPNATNSFDLKTWNLFIILGKSCDVSN